MSTPSRHIGPQLPAGTRIYAIGDVHGRVDLLDTLLARIARDAADAPQRKVLILLGDMIDRGPYSRDVLRRAAALRDGRMLPAFEVHILKGNHEQLMLDFLDRGDDHAGEVWLHNGGAQTLRSLNITPQGPFPALRRALNTALGAKFRALLDSLELCHKDGDYAFVHAGIRPGVAWKDQSPTDMLWIRHDFTASEADFGYVVVHGHTPAEAPQVHHNRIGIDTRAWSSGRLTCVVLQGTQHRFICT